MGRDNYEGLVNFMQRGEKIDKLTPAQELLIPVYRNKWLSVGKRTTPIDKEKAIAAVKTIYKCAGLEEPKYFFFFSSPLQCQLACNLMKRLSENVGCDIKNNLSNDPRNNLMNNLKDNLWNNLERNLWNNLWNNLGDNLKRNLWNNLMNNLKNNLWNNLMNNLENNMGNNLWNNLMNNLKNNLWNNLGDNLKNNLWNNLMNKLENNIWGNIGSNLDIDLAYNATNNLENNLWNNMENNLMNNLKDNLGDNLKNNLWNNLMNKLENNMGNNLWNNLWNNLMNNLKNNLWNNLGDNLKNNLWNNLMNNLKNNPWNNLMNNLENNLKDNLGNNLYINLGSKLGNGFWGNMRYNIWNFLGNNLGDNLKNNLKDNLRDNKADENKPLVKFEYEYTFYANYWIWWVGFYGFILNELFPERKEEFKSFLEYAEACTNVHNFIPFKNIVFISDYPVELSIAADNRLHADYKPAMSYSDGYSLFYLNGIKMQKEVVLSKPEDIDASLILKETNAEVRRELVRKIGIDRIVKDLNAIVLDEKTFEVGGKYQLVQLDLGDGRQRPYLRMMNQSIGVVHVEGVPPETKTVDEALAWRTYQKTYLPPKILT